MGRYFGIGNSTSNQHVSSYWKGDSWCDCHQVMHQLHWKKTDEIFSVCHDTMCVFKYDKKTKSMIVTEIENNNDKNNKDSEEEEEESNDSEESLPAKYYGFDDILGSKQFSSMLNHVPDWDGDVCRTCKYEYDDTKLNKYEKKFNNTYFMS